MPHVLVPRRPVAVCRCSSSPACRPCCAKVLISTPPAAPNTDDALSVLATLRRDPSTAPEASDWFTQRGDSLTAGELRRWYATTPRAALATVGAALLSHLVSVSRPVRVAVGSEALARVPHAEIARRVDEALLETHPQLRGTSPARWRRVPVDAGPHSVWTPSWIRLRPSVVPVTIPGLTAMTGHPVEALVAVWIGRRWWRRFVSVVEPKHVRPLMQGLWPPGATGGANGAAEQARDRREDAPRR